MARPTLKTPKVQRTICSALRDGHSFEVACEFAGIAASTAYEWCARGEGHDRRRPATSPYREFAEAVARAEAAVWRDEIHDGFAEPSERSENGQAAEEHEGARRSTFSDVDELRPPATSHHAHTTSQADDVFAEPQNRSETGTTLPAKASESQRDAEFAEPGFSDTPRDRARAREKNGGREPRRAPMPWLSQRSRAELGILDEEF